MIETNRVVTIAIDMSSDSDEGPITSIEGMVLSPQLDMEMYSGDKAAKELFADLLFKVEERFHNLARSKRKEVEKDSSEE